MSVTRQLAAYAAGSRFDALPETVRTEAARAFLNWIGCVLGGCREPPVERAAAALAAGPPQATVIGHRQRTDIASAALLNCFSSSVLAFDDTHLATVTHPTGPVAAALLALGETRPVSGEEFVTALALGIEIECRMSNVLLLPPARANVGLYVTGLTGPIGAAAALGHILDFDERRMNWAIGLAATQASGFRATHGSMTGLLVPALGARNGVAAALLAAEGFTCSENVLEADKGFIGTFSEGADLGRATDRLGERFELLANAYKPYPCGIVIHPALDACLELAGELPVDARVESVTVTVHPLTLALTDRRSPVDSLEAQISLYHWAAAALLRRSAGVAELQQDCIEDPAIAALRARVAAHGDPKLRRDEAIAEVTLADGATRRVHVAAARGSLERPMTDDDLDRKFYAQVTRVLSRPIAERLLRICRDVVALYDVGGQIASILEE
jgi:2-methylcitrate dehydratase PrpD